MEIFSPGGPEKLRPGPVGLGSGRVWNYLGQLGPDFENVFRAVRISKNIGPHSSSTDC